MNTLVAGSVSPSPAVPRMPSKPPHTRLASHMEQLIDIEHPSQAASLLERVVCGAAGEVGIDFSPHKTA